MSRLSRSHPTCFSLYMFCHHFRTKHQGWATYLYPLIPPLFWFPTQITPIIYFLELLSGCPMCLNVILLTRISTCHVLYFCWFSSWYLEVNIQWLSRKTEGPITLKDHIHMVQKYYRFFIFHRIFLMRQSGKKPALVILGELMVGWH